MKVEQSIEAGLTLAQQSLNALGNEHLREEFATKDTTATLDTMVLDAYVNHIPVLPGGVGRDLLIEPYSKQFIPKMLSDTEIVSPQHRDALVRKGRIVIVSMSSCVAT